MQLPLPRQIDESLVVERVDPTKDVDGFHPGQLRAAGGRARPVSFRARRWAFANSCSRRKSRPAAPMPWCWAGHASSADRWPFSCFRKAQGGDATVTVCHTATRDAAAIARQADLLFVAMGRPDLVTADWVKPGAVVDRRGHSQKRGRPPLRRCRLRKCFARRLAHHARTRRRGAR